MTETKCEHGLLDDCVLCYFDRKMAEKPTIVAPPEAAPTPAEIAIGDWVKLRNGTVTLIDSKDVDDRGEYLIGGGGCVNPQDVVEIRKGAPSVQPEAAPTPEPCGEPYRRTGIWSTVTCSRPAGHEVSHRGDFPLGSVQWPVAAPPVQTSTPEQDNPIAALASAMRKLLPPELLTEVLGYLDPFTRFRTALSEVAAPPGHDQ